jgi:hypothetical protein
LTGFRAVLVPFRLPPPPPESFPPPFVRFRLSVFILVAPRHTASSLLLPNHPVLPNSSRLRQSAHFSPLFPDTSLGRSDRLINMLLLHCRVLLLVLPLVSFAAAYIPAVAVNDTSSFDHSQDEITIAFYNGVYRFVWMRGREAGRARERLTR